MGSLRLALGNAALLTLMLGHFTNDTFAGVLPMLFPTIKDRFGLTNGEVGIATLAYTSASSLSQPFFGYLSDRHGRRWYASTTLVWGATFVAAYGFAGSYSVFLLLAFLAGIGSGAYHPLGASNAAAVTDERYRNAALSLYTVGGTSGYALGPLIAAGLLALFGARGTALLLLPGVLVAALILPRMRAVERARRAGTRLTGPPPPMIPGARRMLGRLIVVVALRSWVFLSVIQFVPIWYDDLGYRSGFYGAMVTTIILAGAVGTLLGGAMADRIGQRRIVTLSLVLAVPSLLLFVGLPGPLALISGALFGLTCDASLSVTLVAAQRLLPGQTGMASGVILGLGFITGGVGVWATGVLADAVGVPTALAIVGLLCLVAAAVAITVPWDNTGRRAADDEAMLEAAGVHASPSASG